MPAKHKRVSVSVGPDVLARLGIDPARGARAAARAGAVERYADQFAVAAGDLNREWKPAVWKLLADVCRGVEFPAEADASALTHLHVAELLRCAHRDRRAGDVYLMTPGERGTLTAAAFAERADRRVAEVVSRLHELTPVHGAAILAGVRWFWAHHTETAVIHGQWWMPYQRVQYVRRAPPVPTDAPLAQPTLFDEVPDGETE